jgi:hypothetical protein
VCAFVILATELLDIRPKARRIVILIRVKCPITQSPEQVLLLSGRKKGVDIPWRRRNINNASPAEGKSTCGVFLEELN